MATKTHDWVAPIAGFLGAVIGAAAAFAGAFYATNRSVSATVDQALNTDRQKAYSSYYDTGERLVSDFILLANYQQKPALLIPGTPTFTTLQAHTNALIVAGAGVALIASEEVGSAAELCGSDMTAISTVLTDALAKKTLGTADAPSTIELPRSRKVDLQGAATVADQCLIDFLRKARVDVQPKR